ncbi:MAG: hypothetical protein JNL47_04285 [Bacteroidia bacterium]|nr:hypothetical protein [Bacteroidia bacterium]
MHKLILIIPASLFALSASAQEKNKKNYILSASELIFSSGEVTDGDMKIDPVVRFSGFFHFQTQAHYDFNKFAGVYTGIGMRNVGFINKLNDSVRIKQRSYSLGIPFAVKLGDMNERVWVAAGAEAELMFAYKQKVFYGGQKFKNHKWFSDKVNLFNPSVFAEVKFKRGGYIRAKYYLKDFLQKDKQDIRLFGVPYEFSPEESKLFYLSIGSAIEPKKAKRKKGKINTARIS